MNPLHLGVLFQDELVLTQGEPKLDQGAEWKGLNYSAGSDREFVSQTASEREK